MYGILDKGGRYNEGTAWDAGALDVHRHRLAPPPRTASLVRGAHPELLSDQLRRLRVATLQVELEQVPSRRLGLGVLGAIDLDAAVKLPSNEGPSTGSHHSGASNERSSMSAPQ